MLRRTFLAGAAAAGALAARPARAQSPRFTDAALYSAERDGTAFLVARNGVILFEHYPRGARETRWPIGRGARLYAAVLAAALVDDRILNLDQAAVASLPEWSGHPLKEAITLRNLLSGASGLSFGPRQAQSTATALALEPQGPPGVSYSDDAAGFVIFTEIARRRLAAAGRIADPADYLFARVLQPIGCDPVQWARGPDGAPRFDDGAAVSARDWAQAGELMRRDGVWRAQQLIDERAVHEALRGSFAEPRVGFGVLLAAPGARRPGALAAATDLWRMNGAPAGLAMAAGEGGQRLYIAPSRNLVAVRLANAAARRDWSDAAFLSLLLRDA